ncbi:hypothetical protein DLM75_06735 [Leptospira stimsonii]|uniref:Uncharacterized protein n=1 Tax=Leptospira stimsonii TaxID=2202203 RepID=A0A396ZG06_9LEPT|nr:hypothetical protein DLM75_06735 [Leptospira stimsonii]
MSPESILSVKSIEEEIEEAHLLTSDLSYKEEDFTSSTLGAGKPAAIVSKGKVRIELERVNRIL